MTSNYPSSRVSHGSLASVLDPLTSSVWVPQLKFKLLTYPVAGAQSASCVRQGGVLTGLVMGVA